MEVARVFWFITIVEHEWQELIDDSVPQCHLQSPVSWDRRSHDAVLLSAISNEVWISRSQGRLRGFGRDRSRSGNHSEPVVVTLLDSDDEAVWSFARRQRGHQGVSSPSERVERAETAANVDHGRSATLATIFRACRSQVHQGINVVRWHRPAKMFGLIQRL